VFVFRKPLYTVIMAPKRKSCDAGSASVPKRSRDILSICGRLKIVDMIVLKKTYLEIAAFYGKN